MRALGIPLALGRAASALLLAGCAARPAVVPPAFAGDFLEHESRYQPHLTLTCDEPSLPPIERVVFRAATREVRASVRLTPRPAWPTVCDQGSGADLVGISPRRGLVVLGETQGLFHETGQSEDDGCYGVAAAQRYTVFRVEP